MNKHLRAANKIGQEMKAHIEKQRKEDPELDKWMKTHPL